MISLICLLVFAALSAPVSEAPRVNPTYSPDSSFVAFTAEGDLYVEDLRSSTIRRLTSDGSATTLNGYASWVYYEEIFGRSSRYRAFWWSPDSRKIAFYSFDDSVVPIFPIYSPFGQDGTLRCTHYPKAGERNPSVSVRIADLQKDTILTVFSDKQKCYNGEQVCYIGTPFWRTDASELVFPVMPRVQQDLELIAADASGAGVRSVYKEHSDTWLEWPETMLFGRDGLYVARCFETNWQQIYFISYDGLTVRKLTSGSNWDVQLIDISKDERIIYFTAKVDGALCPALYSLNVRKAGKADPVAVTPTDMWVADVNFSKDLSSFTAKLSNSRTPECEYRYTLKRGKWSRELLEDHAPKYNLEGFNLPEPVYMTTSDGVRLPAMMALPRDFDPSGKYPVAMMIYGGPGNPYVRDRWTQPDGGYYDWRWFQENGIIRIIADTRVAGHIGREGVDRDYLDVISAPVEDLVQWARWLQAQSWVDGAHIGIEGFSFGGAMTSVLVLEHPECYCCGIAGGGVYDWMLYDSHYTERFMNTPWNNPEGYRRACVLERVRNLAAEGKKPSSRLMLTHGTGDDNVHFQNTLQMVDELQKALIQFDLMVYPDGMHGYRAEQAAFSSASDHAFWLRHLFD